MCGGVLSKLLFGSDKRPQARAPEATGRQPGQVKGTEAIVKQNDSSDMVTSVTDVAVRKDKKNSRRGVPGLNL